MDIQEDVIVESSPTEVVAVSEDVKTPTEETPKVSAKVVPYERFKEVIDENKKLKEQPVKEVNKALDVDDYIDISASLEGLDQREKEYLAKMHKLTGQPLGEIRNSEDFQLWDSAHRARVEKENALKPSNTADLTPKEQSFEERLANADMAGKEQLLKEAGLLKDIRKRTDTVNIGTQR